jgi:hypothetical protein
MEEMGLAEIPDEFLSLISPIDIRKISGRIVSLSDVLDCVSFVEEGIDSSVSSSHRRILRVRVALPHTSPATMLWPIWRIVADIPPNRT